MTEKEKWIVDEDDELSLFYGDENFNGNAYPCNEIVFMKMIADKLNKLEEENEQLKQQDKINEDCYKKLLQKYDDLKKENEHLKEQLLDANELNGVYVDFLVDKGFELSDVVEWSKRSNNNGFYR